MASLTIEEAPPKKRLKPDYTDLLTAIVGEDTGEQSKTFPVHKDSLCDRSPFFAKATSGSWLKAADRVIRLPSVEPGFFEAYIHWTYTSKVDLRETCEQHVACDHEPGCLPLAKFWVLGDMLLDHELCNLVIEKIWRKLGAVGGRKIPSPRVMCYLFENTSADSPLRRLFTDMWAVQANIKNFAAKEGELPQELILEFARRFFEGPRPDDLGDLLVYFVKRSE